MAVEFLCQTFGRQFTSEITGRKTAVRVYYCKLDAGVDDLADVLDQALTSSMGFPALGDDYGAGSALTGLVATSHEPVEIQRERGFYQIKVNYETQTLDMAPPTERPWTITFSSERVEIVPALTQWNTGVVFPLGQILAVAAGQPIVNSAGDPFDPPVTSFRIRPIITLQKNFTELTDIGAITTIAQLMSYVGKVNNAPITIAGIYANYGQFLVDDINCVRTEEDGQDFYNTTIRIIYDEEYFCEKVLNAGFNEAGVPPKPILASGIPVTSPQLLDAAGAKITGTPAAKKAAAIYYAFGTQDGIAYSDLGLPTTF